MHRGPIRHGLLAAGLVLFVVFLVPACGSSKPATDTSATTDTPIDTSTAPTMTTDTTLTADQTATVDDTLSSTAANTAGCYGAMGSPSNVLASMLGGIRSAHASSRVALVKSSMRSAFRATSKRDACVSALSSNASTLGSYGDMGIFSLQKIVGFLQSLMQWASMMFQNTGIGRMQSLMGPLSPMDF